MKPEDWWQRSNGTTSPAAADVVVDVVDLTAWGPLEQHCTEARASGNVARASFGDQALSLLAELRSAIGFNDAEAAAAAGFRLGRLLHDWNVKDFTEADFRKGIAAGRAQREASRAAAASRTLAARRRASKLERAVKKLTEKSYPPSRAVARVAGSARKPKRGGIRGLSIEPRSLQRALQRQKKKRATSRK